MCSQLPDSFCKGDTELKQAIIVRVDRVREFTTAMWRRAMYGKKGFADHDTIERRARTCMSGGPDGKKCEFHDEGICTTCNQLKGFKNLLVGARRTEYDAGLGVCAVCGCMLEVKILLSDKALAKCKDRGYPDYCWMKSIISGESENE